MVKDYILKKYSWFYKFEDIFYKYSIISLLLLIESKQPIHYNRANINDSELKKFDFNLKETLKTYKEIKNIKLRLLLGNYNNNDNLDFNFYFVFF